MATKKNTTSFRGQTVLVTGASSGIGKATALAFAETGANVVLVARRASTLADVAKEARNIGVPALAVPTDVTQMESVAACFEKAVARFGAVDIVVNNAGVLTSSNIVDLTAADLQRMLDVNLFGALYVMQQAVLAMREQGRGHIVNVGSLAGRRGFSGIGGYSATKFALVGLTEALRTELAGDDINVSLVLPGVVDTPMAAGIKSTEGGAVFPERYNMPPSWVVRSIFLAIRFRLTEIGVPPGAALLGKLAALAPGAADALLSRATDAMQRHESRRRETSK